MGHTEMGEINDKVMSSVLKHRLFKGLDRSQIERILSYSAAKAKLFERGEVVLHMDDRLKSVILILSGRLNVIQQTRDGTELIDITLESGGMVGASFALARGEHYPRMIEAADDSELVMLDLAKVRDLLKESGYHQLFENFYSFLVAALMNNLCKFSAVGCWEIGDKVLTYVERIAEATGSREVKIPFRTCAEFAQFLGVNRCALSRSLSQLERKGELAHKRGLFILPKR